jgi:hypothetical protein
MNRDDFFLFTEMIANRRQVLSNGGLNTGGLVATGSIEMMTDVFKRSMICMMLVALSFAFATATGCSRTETPPPTRTLIQQDLDFEKGTIDDVENPARKSQK